MVWKHPQGHQKTLKLIKSCAENGVGIESLPDAGVNFRFIPAAPKIKDSFTPDTNAANGGYEGNHGPSNRGSIARGQPRPKHIKSWTPSRLDANPMYAQPMAGDCRKLTAARLAWSKGNPKPLREYLRALADGCRASMEYDL